MSEVRQTVQIAGLELFRGIFWRRTERYVALRVVLIPQRTD